MFAFDFHEAVKNWERLAIQQLYDEYDYVLRERKIYLRPAAIDLFDSDHCWGDWHVQTRTIRLSRRLLRSYSWFHVIGILKHEMAHQFVDEYQMTKKESERVHGEVFLWACKKLGVPDEFSKASVNLQKNSLDWRDEKQDDFSEKMLEKVKKLLALAQSSNEHEALAAMNKVRELYAKYQIEKQVQGASKAFVHLVISNGRKRIETYEQSIIGILVGHFFVKVITGKVYDVKTAEHHQGIELIGSRENVLMAEYVFHFLVHQSEQLVQQFIKTSLQSVSRVTRKSYRLGILNGFAEKLRVSEKRDVSGHESVVSQALTLFKNDEAIKEYIGGVYPRLRQRSASRIAINPSAYSMGVSEGRRINLNKPVTSREQGRVLSLGTSMKK